MDGLTLASSASSSTGDLPPQEDARLTTYYKLLPPWKSLASSHQVYITIFSAIPVSISRVNQVDAARLDIEMSAMLKEQLVKVFSLMKECYFNMSQNLMLSWSSLSGVFLSGLISLHWYRNLIERALRARLVYGSPNMNRAVSFEYMNRQLVWNEFSELLLLLLPLLNSSSIKNFLLPFSKDKSSDSSVDDTSCPICQGKPTIPFLTIPCQHRGDILLVRSSCHPFGLTSFMCRFIALVLVTVVHVSFMYLHHYTAAVTTVFKHGAPLLRLFAAPDVVNRLLLCNDMVVRSTTLVRYNNSLER
uniref:RING-type E3 ubiquitin transferase (cysteine targeting) n=1 Tax=Solanum tuberosum TaxID=4113 RepID=M0ZRY9_SOLTU